MTEIRILNIWYFIFFFFTYLLITHFQTHFKPRIIIVFYYSVILLLNNSVNRFGDNIFGFTANKDKSQFINLRGRKIDWRIRFSGGIDGTHGSIVIELLVETSAEYAWRIHESPTSYFTRLEFARRRYHYNALNIH